MGDAGPLDDVSRCAASPEEIAHVDPPQYQHLAVLFHLAADFTRQVCRCDFDLARCQRARKGAGESSAGGGDHIVDRGGVWFEHRRVEAVMFGNSPMNTEQHRG